MAKSTAKEVALPVVALKSGVFRYKQKTRNVPYKDVPNCPVSKNVLYPNLDASKEIENEDSLLLHCSLIYEEGSSKLFFKIPNEKLYRNTGEVKHTMLECTDISAADLKVSTKFGCWDSISCRLLIECSKPLLAWSTLHNKTDGQREEENDSVFESDHEPPPGGVTYIAVPQDSCMVKATFDVAYVTKLRDLLHSVKVAKLHERKLVLDNRKKGIDKKIPVPVKIQEGLPEWVNYIPAKWYSSTIRKVIEYILLVYTILTLSWAVWQLYKHVDFIQRYLRPILQFIEMYFDLLKRWFRWLDGFVEVLTEYWWAYMKPVYLLAAPLYASLAQLFKPLRNIAGMITAVSEPVIGCFRTVASVLKPLFQPAASFFNIFTETFRKLFGTFMTMWNMVMETVAVQFVLTKCRDVGLSGALHQVVHGGLDPFRAQVVVVRDLLIRSMKQIFYALKFIITRIIYMQMFVQRERQYANEDQSEVVVNDKAKTE